MTNEDYKRLTEIDNKMINDEEITEEERRERLAIIERFQKDNKLK
jgi:hypothetical protein